MKSCIKSSKDIVVGQFYKAAEDWYYIGIKYGRNKRLAVINLEPREAADNSCPMFPNDKSMYKDWGFSSCTQDEVMKNY